MRNNNTLVFATSNKNKVLEVKKLLGEDTTFEIKSLSEMSIKEEIPETGNTIEANAIQKAAYLYDNYNINCFAEDTGLFIDSLNGEPGVYSARYAGEESNSEKNIKKVLKKLKDSTNRTARFITVIALIIDGKITTFEGKIEGEITKKKSGTTGFGYDPIFKPNGYEMTFAELGSSIKNEISHRAIATKKLVKHLNSVLYIG